MLNDKNAAAMEKGLEPIYAFYDRYDHAAKYELSCISATPVEFTHLESETPLCFASHALHGHKFGSDSQFSFSSLLQVHRKLGPTYHRKVSWCSSRNEAEGD